MDLRRVSRYATKREFWRGFGVGFRASLKSPTNRARYDANFRIAFYSSAVGSAGLLAWVKHSRATTGRPPLTTAQELGVSLKGALAVVVLVLVLKWLWRRWMAFRAA